MDPVTLIVTALAVGASAGLKPTAEQAVKDAYAGLKTLIKRKYAQMSAGVDYFETDPGSEPLQQHLQSQFAQTAAGQDQELLQEAQNVLQVVEAKAPEAIEQAGVSLETVRAGASLIIENIDFQGQGDGNLYGVKAKDVEAKGDIKISGVKVTSGPTTDNH